MNPKIKTTLLLTMLLSLGFAALAAAAPDDAQRIQGAWFRTSAVLGDTPFPADITKPVDLQLKDGSYEKTFDGGEPEKGTYTIDSTTNPKALTLTCTEGAANGKTMLCIYEFDGDALRIGIALPGTKERPVSFKGSSDPSHLFTETYKPAQDKEAPEAPKTRKSIAGAAAAEAKGIQGSWSRTSAVLGNTPFPAESLSPITLTLKNGKYEKTPKGGQPEKGTYILDTTTNPVSLTLTCTEGEDAGKKILGICQLDGDTLRICVDPTGAQRPALFINASDTQQLFTETYKRTAR